MDIHGVGGIEMAEEGQEEQPKSSGRTSMKVDLKDLYKFDSSDLIVEIGAEYYSVVYLPD